MGVSEAGQGSQPDQVEEPDSWLIDEMVALRDEDARLLRAKWMAEETEAERAKRIWIEQNRRRSATGL